mgnify:CR=1 FL=1
MKPTRILAGAALVAAVLATGSAHAQKKGGDITALVQHALGEPCVEVHADAAQVVAQAGDDVVIVPYVMPGFALAIALSGLFAWLGPGGMAPLAMRQSRPCGGSSSSSLPGGLVC